ncbi:MAG: hypothetical protein Q8P80_03720, partial [Candidatus Levybacteria bacterium]|nr:hypothetical protein [Candidatus Levybacteria bacterium]
NKNQQTELSPSPAQFSPISPHMIVYGTWSGSSSNIKAYDLSTGKTYVLAKLPSNVKKVSILSSDKLIYINDTDDKDHGKEIAIYSLATKQSTTVFKANRGFGIDDYVLSPNKKYLSDWEVSFLGDSNALRGGRSQVYSVDLSTPNVKNQIYDEIANTPIHYPLGVTDSGEIYLDTFLPNSGAGWAYGMSTSNLNGSSKQDIANMQNGTYGTQPTLSPDGKYLAFAGYEGTDGKDVTNGTRKAILNPNTVELLDIKTNQRIKIQPDSPAQYSALSWEKESDNLSFLKVSNQNNESGFYLYNPGSQTTKKINNLGPKQIFVSSLSDEKILLAEFDSSLSTFGNLGSKYSMSFTKIFTFNPINSQIKTLDLADSFIQYITLTPSSFFQNTKLEEESTFLSTPGKRSLQLETFTFKPSLATQRIEQQTQEQNQPPVCIMNTDLLSTSSSCAEDDTMCYINIFRASIVAGECGDSPLYLYGAAGQKVKVSIKTPIFSSSPLYKDEYEVVLLDSGKMQINEGVFERIKYDYIPQEKIVEPNYGTVVIKENLAGILQTYALNLGLNAKETKDLIEGTKSISSPLVFVSFFDDKTSKVILPIEFTPKPDVYINIVFYLKGLTQVPKELQKEPVFETLPFRN